MTPAASTPTGEPLPAGPRTRWGRIAQALFLPAALAVIVGAAIAVPLPMFVETPREPVSLDERIVVDGSSDALGGDYLLLAVSLRRGTVTRVLHALVDDDRNVVADVQIVPPHEDDATYFARQRDVFHETAVVAAGLGLQAAGYPVDLEAFTGDGVMVMSVIEDTPAAASLEPGDVIVAVDGAPVRSFEDLRSAMPAEVGARVDIVVQRGDTEHPIALEAAELETAAGRQPGLGIVGHTHEPRIELPVEVEVEGGRIGGPSAGLMIALTVLDKADPDLDLAAGRRIAGTGRVGRDGDVARVGGIRQKVAAAHAAGADVLLVPEDHADDAAASLPRGSDLEIVGVATFSDAVEALLPGSPTASARG